MCFVAHTGLELLTIHLLLPLNTRITDMHFSWFHLELLEFTAPDLHRIEELEEGRIRTISSDPRLSAKPPEGSKALGCEKARGNP